jgi:hypothetical protein
VGNWRRSEQNQTLYDQKRRLVWTINQFSEVTNTHSVAVCLFSEEMIQTLQGTIIRGRYKHRKYHKGAYRTGRTVQGRICFILKYLGFWAIWRVGLHGEEILILNILAVAPPTSPLSGDESSMLSKKMWKLCTSFFFFFSFVLHLTQYFFIYKMFFFYSTTIF